MNKFHLISKITLSLLIFHALSFGSKEDLTLARKYFRDEQYKFAEKHFRDFLNAHSTDKAAPKAKVELAQTLFKLEKYLEADKLYQEFLVSFPDHSLTNSVLFERAELAAKLKNYQTASELFYRYARLINDSNTETAMFLALKYAYTSKDYISSKTYALQYLERYPKSSKISHCYRILGNIDMQENSYFSAIDQYKKSIKTNADPEFQKIIHIQLAKAYFSINNKKETEAALSEVFKNATRYDSLYIFPFYLTFLKEENRYADIASFVEQINPDMTEEQQLEYYKGLNAQGNYPKTIKWINESTFTLESNKVAAQFILAEAHLKDNDRQEGVAILNKLGEEGHAEGHIKAGEAYSEDKMYQNAIQSFNKAMNLVQDKRKETLLLKIGQIYEFNLLRLNLARKIYNDFITNYPSSSKSAQALMGIGRCYESEGNFKDATLNYKRVFQEYSNSSMAQEAKSKYEYIQNFKLSEKDAALEHVLYIIEKPNTPDRLLKIARVFEEDLKNHKRAFNYYQKFLNSSDATSDRKAYALYKSAAMKQKLSKKAHFEKNLNQEASEKSEAKTLFAQVIQQYPKSKYADDAEFQNLQMNTFNTESYAKFLEKYPASNRTPEVLFQLGDHYLDQSRVYGGSMAQKAVGYFQRILNEFPKSKLVNKALLHASKAYLESNQLDKVRPTLDILLGKSNIEKELEAQSNLLIAQMYLKNRDYTQAIKWLKNIPYKYHTTTAVEEASYILAVAYKQDNQIKQSKMAFERFLLRYADSKYLVQVTLELANLFEKQEKLDKAIHVLQGFVKNNSEHEDISRIYQQMGFYSLAEQKKLDAIEMFKQAIANSKTPLNRVETHLSELYLETQQYDSAALYFKKNLSSSLTQRDSVKAWSGYISSISFRKTSADFDREYKKFKGKFGKDEEFHAKIIYYNALSLLHKKKNKNAEKRFEYLIDKFEETTWAGEGVYYQGVILFKKGKFKEALKQFEFYTKTYKNGPGFMEAIFKIASCHYQLKNLENAVKHYGIVIQSSKASPILKYRAVFNSAVIFEKTSQWMQSAKMYSTIIEKYSDVHKGAPLWVNTGFSWFHAKEYEKALEIFTKALEEKESERKPEAHYWYAKTLKKLGKIEESIAEFLKVNYLYSGVGMWGLTSLFEVGQSYELQGDLEKAQRMYQKIVERDGLQGTLGSKAAIHLKNMEEKYNLNKG